MAWMLNNSGWVFLVPVVIFVMVLVLAAYYTWKGKL